MKRLVPARVYVSVFFAAAVAFFALAFAPNSVFAITPSFTAGQKVATIGNANIRATADGTLVGTQPKGAAGLIAAGPVTVSGNAVTWYQVTFGAGASGWVGADMLTAATAAPKAAVI